KNGIKVLGKGELKAPITVQAHKFSQGAIKKIVAAGGEAKVIPC
ncbi:MAG: uL15m family ribosomal protein, partial [Planctomycetota bacterium]